MSEDEIIKKSNAIMENHRVIDSMMVIEIVDLVQGLLDLYRKEKQNNKKLERENQALFESINLNDDNMLTRLYMEEKEKNKELEYKINQINNIINTNPYTAYTLYGDILYDDQAIRDIIEDTHKFKGELF